ncbi:putative conjugative element protein [Streptococcus pneumoniae]|nr:putative conjugative element protein [Streptococcus pneumoniae]
MKKGGFSMKKIIFIKTIELLAIDGIMLAFLTFKEGLTWDWILIYSGWLIFFHPVLLAYLSNQLCDHFSHLYSQIRPKFWHFALQILLWDSLMILSLICLSGVPLLLQGTLLILGHLISSYRISQRLKRDFPKAYQETISFWSIL